jgi:hypothetical protein
MKEIWFWMSKDLAELGIVAIVILIAIVWFGGKCLIDMIKRRLRSNKKRGRK